MTGSGSATPAEANLAECGADSSPVEAAREMVEKYAPGAPAAIKNEAVHRFAGYLKQASFGAIAKDSVGPLQIEYAVNHANAFRNSDAAMLLSRWRVRRAGKIG